jgi:hypothetical protein
LKERDGTRKMKHNSPTERKAAHRKYKQLRSDRILLHTLRVEWMRMKYRK